MQNGVACVEVPLVPGALGHLLSFFNGLWDEAYVPKAWKTAQIIPLLKAGKDSTLPSSPIAFTNCLGKTYERLINRWLVYFLKEQSIIGSYQCGFYRGWSTLDHLVRL